MAAKKQLKKLTLTPKVNKEAKPTEIEPNIISDEVYRCSCCGHKYKKQEGKFNKSKSPIYRGNNGYTTICKKCISQLYEGYIKFFDRDEDSAMERICQITDMVVDDVAWAASRKISENRNRMSAYVAKLNLRQSDGETYSDTLVRRWEAQVENAESAKEVEQNDDITVAPDTVRRFGVGFKENEYEAMEFEYNSWVEKYGEPIDKRQEELYVSMCYLKLNLQKGIQNDSNGMGTLANSYKAFIEAATTEIEDRKKKAQADMELKPLGILIRDIERFCPAEYYKDKKLYVDYDSLKDYISRFMTRPLCNLLTGSKENDKEFNLSDTEE